MPEKSKLRDWITVASQPPVVIRSVRVSLVVGTLLALINHGDSLFAGELGMAAAGKIVLTYLVPYGVATWSAVQTTLAREAQGE